jgi:hypothetical protein
VVRTWWKWILGGLALALLLVYIAAFFAAEPLRRVVERQANARLQGYTMRIGQLDLHPIPLSLDLRDVVILQHAAPERPIATLPRVSVSMHWGAFLRGRLAGNIEAYSPAAHMDRDQLAHALENPVPLTEKGRQEVPLAVRSRRISQFIVRNGSFAYTDSAQGRPLALTRLEAVVTDIGKVPSDVDVYPSRMRLTGVVFDNGSLQMDGHGDLLGVPHAAFKGHVALDRIVLNYIAPIVERHGFTIIGGTVRATGQVEYAPHVKIVELEEIRVDRLEGDYVYRKATVPAVTAAKAAAETAEEVSSRAEVSFKARRVSVHRATVGFVNERASPRYRVFLADTDLTFENFSTRFTDGTASARLTGRFMGSGDTTISATFRPEPKGADFDVEARIGDTDLTTMNDLLRGHAKVDLASGGFSMFSQARVRSGGIEGYVKPLFRHLRLYGPEQDADKSLGQKFKERGADVIAKVLRNRPRQEVATVVPLTGPLENQKANTWEALVGLVRNAFDKAILPGFERERFGLGR